MNVLVAYESLHGATRGIAERIADRLRAGGHRTELAPVASAPDVTGHEAFVIGSAVYIGHWQKEALELVRAHAALLAARPTWLFSCGPLGSEPLDDQGRDKRRAAAPEEAGELTDLVHPRDHHVFFGALNPDDLPVIPRLMRILPAGRRLLEEGDFRDWAEIDAWADGIAGELLRQQPAEAAAGEARQGRARGQPSPE
jgi:menaquinone-dependent protoporphyrinogen oxidase